MVTGLERPGDLSGGPARPNGHSIAKRLGQRDHVGCDPGVFKAKPPAGTTQPGLHLVHHEQHAPLVTQRPHCLEVAVGSGNDATLTLYRLQQHSGHGGVQVFLKLSHIAVGHMPESAEQGNERLLLCGLTGCSQGPHRPTVE